jgi:hypothetical protein
MTGPTDNAQMTALDELHQYITDVTPLLALWNETVELLSVAEVARVIPCLQEILRHAQQVDVSDGLWGAHQTLLMALSTAVETYGRADGHDAEASTAAVLGMQVFERIVIRQYSAALATREPAFEYFNLVRTAQHLIGLVQVWQGHHRHLDIVEFHPYFEAIHIHNWLPGSVCEPMLHIPNNLDLDAVDFERTKM